MKHRPSEHVTDRPSEHVTDRPSVHSRLGKPIAEPGADNLSSVATASDNSKTQRDRKLNRRRSTDTQDVSVTQCDPKLAVRRIIRIETNAPDGDRDSNGSGDLRALLKRRKGSVDISDKPGEYSDVTSPVKQTKKSVKERLSLAPGAHVAQRREGQLGGHVAQRRESQLGVHVAQRRDGQLGIKRRVHIEPVDSDSLDNQRGDRLPLKQHGQQHFGRHVSRSDDGDHTATQLHGAVIKRTIRVSNESEGSSCRLTSSSKTQSPDRVTSSVRTEAADGGSVQSMVVKKIRLKRPHKPEGIYLRCVDSFNTALVCYHCRCPVRFSSLLPLQMSRQILESATTADVPSDSR